MPATLIIIAALAVGVEVRSDDPEFAKRVEQIAERLIKLRQLEFKDPVTVGVMDRKRLDAELQEELDKELSPKKERSERLVLARLGLIPEDMNLRKFVEGLYGEQMAGFYDDEKKELYLIREGPGQRAEDDEHVVAHELTHALQDQHYDLTKLTRPLKSQDDMRLAVMALVEGDATVAMIEYMIAKEDVGPMAAFLMRKSTNLLMSNAGLMMKLLGGMGEDALSKAPNVLKEELIFPYASGLRFVRYGIKSNKWSVMPGIYKNPPLSTEQILHPAKYYRKADWPTQVVTPRVGVLLPGRWDTVSQKVAGELGIRLVLSEHLPKGDDDGPEVPSWNVAAAGWDGDEINIYCDRNNAEAVMMLWYSTWDTEQDAKEFQQALSAWVPVRHRRAKVIQGHAGRWTVGENLIRIDRNGRDVIMLDAPHPMQHAAILKAVREKTWKKEIRRMEDLE